jgi:hypothetical protein
VAVGAAKAAAAHRLRLLLRLDRRPTLRLPALHLDRLLAVIILHRLHLHRRLGRHIKFR